jgi:hypothetical protein
MKQIISKLAAAAAIILLAAGCGGGGAKDSGSGYKEPFGFLEATISGSSKHQTKFSGNWNRDIAAENVKNSVYSKKEETPAQKEILDKMMAGSNRKIAKIFILTSYTRYDDLVEVVFANCSIDNGMKISGSESKMLSLILKIEDFPEIAYPFEKYYIILDKNGNVARLQHVPGSYSYYMEDSDTRNALQERYGFIEAVHFDQARVKKVVEERRKYWEEEFWEKQQ